MATLPPGTIVDLSEYAAEVLRFLPPDGGLVVVVHPSALRATGSAHTQVAQLGEDGLAWLGALDEGMLVTLDEPPDPDARAACAACFLRGERLWEVVRPGALRVAEAPKAPSTVYAGSELRPWIVLGETDTGDLLAAPLNDASNPKWWTPVLPSAALSFPGNVKDAQVELAHVWSLPASIPSVGAVTPAGRGAVEREVRAYVGG
ncbi:MAG: hypothetical protein P1P87_05125 [Trueperaceae bacterium]|nr:hypothetical protein [Trueperaceae bacterium]